MNKRGLARLGMTSALMVLLAGVSPAQQTPDEIAQLKAQLQQLQQQLQTLSKKLEDVSAKEEAGAKNASASASGAPAATSATTADAAEIEAAPAPVTRPLIASSTPMIAPDAVTRPSKPVAGPLAGPSPYQAPPESPLQIRLGDAYITPIGFMDFTGVWRDKAAGGSIGTSFGSIPYGNTYQTNLSEFRLSMQNSRVGFRVDAMVHGAHVLGYMEADFLGNNPANVLVSSNSNTMRSRLYWVDISKGSWELLGGQTWSLITPGRTGINPLPGNIFYTQDMDVNYQAGLVWGRIPELRLVYHSPDNKAHFAIALDNPEQYVGGSGGGQAPTFPSALSALPGTQLNNGASTTSVPNVAPDIIAKLALEPVKQLHIEVAGLARFFKIDNPNTLQHYSAEGAGVSLNLNAEIAKGFHILTNNYWSDGGGRYIFGQAPDLVVRSDGSISPIHSGSTVSGFEYYFKNLVIFGYYGGIYIGRNSALDANGKTYIGYGFPGSGSSQNRTIQEATVGFNEAFWKDPKYGALNLIFQYSYNTRNPWVVAAGAPSNASLNQVYLDLRYTLPGVAPALK